MADTTEVVPPRQSVATTANARGPRQSYIRVEGNLQATIPEEGDIPFLLQTKNGAGWTDQ